MSEPVDADPNDPSTWGALTPATQKLNDLIGINPAPRRLTPVEIELLRQSKREIAQRAMPTKSTPELTYFQSLVNRASLDNPDLSCSFIAESLKSLAEPREDRTPFVPRSRTIAPKTKPPTGI